MRRTKIVCTIGPSSGSEKNLEALIEAGMNVARFNLSHSKKEEYLGQVEAINKISARLNKNVAILFDTRGPEIRTGPLKEEAVILEEGQHFTLTTSPLVGDNKKVSVTYKSLHADLAPGARILIDDGLISLEVLEVEAPDIKCLVINGGELRSYKGLNMPGTRINLPALSTPDRLDLELALKNKVSFLAASFTRGAQDILEVRHFIESLAGEMMILAKIESREGVENFDSILAVADGVMVARGDLGVEVPTEEVPLLQKRFIRQCNEAGKPVITATQMLDSMMRHPVPTRAEASDVANAIFDGTDAVMLSGETALGKYPLPALETMSRIALRVEEDLRAQDTNRSRGECGGNVTEAISQATARLAGELGAAAVLTSTQSGHTARMVSKFKPVTSIIALSSNRRVARELSITWGVEALVYPPAATTDEMFSGAILTSLEAGLIKEGDLVVITAGVPVGVAGTTNLIRVETAGEALLKGVGVGQAAATGQALHLSEEKSPDLPDEPFVLVARTTGPKDLPLLEKASALVLEEEGLTTHGAIVAINLGIPAVVGAKAAFKSIKEGETITVDAKRGLIYQGAAHVL